MKTSKLLFLSLSALIISCSKADENTSHPPSLTTLEISNITNNTAVSGGNITSDNGSTVTARGVVWGTTESPTIADNKTTDGTGTGNFTSDIQGLTANTTYYLRAYATNASGTNYGNQISFTTTNVPVSGTSIQYTVSDVTFAHGRLQDNYCSKWWGYVIEEDPYAVAYSVTITERKIDGVVYADKKGRPFPAGCGGSVLNGEMVINSRNYKFENYYDRGQYSGNKCEPYPYVTKLPGGKLFIVDLSVGGPGACATAAVNNRDVKGKLIVTVYY